MLYILVDETYKNTHTWIERLLMIKREARRRRRDYLEVTSLKDIPEHAAETAVLIRSGSRHYITKMVNEANERGIHPIVMANLPASHGLSCSVISADMRKETITAIEYLKALGCDKLAMFGINPSPYSDVYRAEVFAEYVANDAHLYYMDESYEMTLQRFLKEANTYSGIIVCNTATAIALINTLKQSKDKKEMPKIITFSELNLLNYYNPSITTISSQIDQFGKVVFDVYDMVTKSTNVSSIMVFLEQQIHPRETTGFSKFSFSTSFLQKETPNLNNTYLNSREIREVMQIERMLQQCDDVDMDLLFGLLADKSYEMLASQFFLSVTAVKYRIKKLKAISGQNTVADLKKKLSLYFLYN